MIVYTGKQFWNDFNNGDEWLFQDANRPRDNNKFKIKPWLQSEKIDVKQSAKNIVTGMANMVAAWSRYVNRITSPIVYSLPRLDVKSRAWNPWCKVNNDWDLEITEDGTYIIQAFTEYIFPTNPTSWQNYIEYVALLKLTDKWWVVQTKTQGRVCSNNDQLMTRQVWWFTAWTIFTVWAAHTYWPGTTVELYEAINVQKLG